MPNSPHETSNTPRPSVFDLETRLAPHADKANLMVRIAVGLFLMPHGAQKLFGLFGGYGLEATGQFFEAQMGFSNGYLVALLVGATEFFGGLFLALGLLTRISALGMAVLLAVAADFHLGAGFFWNKGGYEYPMLWTILSASFVIKGGGAYSLDRKFGLRL